MGELGPLCAGIDPHPGLLARAGWPDTVDSLRRFCDVVLDGVSGEVAAVKPQSAFFERYGSAGIAVLEGFLREVKTAGIVSILDVKRGDIGSTMQAYTDAYLLDSSPLVSDAVTVSPYLGFESLAPALKAAEQHNRGVFVLALTSNSEGADVQHRGVPSVAASIIEHAGRANRAAMAAVGDDAYLLADDRLPGHVGLVLGATVGEAVQRLGLRQSVVDARAIVLAPGVGAQGATPQDLATTFDGCTDRVLAPVSRGLLSVGLDSMAIRGRCKQLNDQLGHSFSS